MDQKTKKTLNIVNDFLRAEHARVIGEVVIDNDGFIIIDGQLFTPAIDTVISAIYGAAADRIVETAAMRPGYYFYIIASNLSAYDYEDINYRDIPRRIAGGRITGTAPARNPARGAMLVMRDYYRARRK